MKSYNTGLELIGRLQAYTEWQNQLKDHIKKLEDQKRDLAKTLNKLSNSEDMTEEQWLDLCERGRPHF